jgi:hypothetical protein
LEPDYIFYCIECLTEAIAGATKNSGNLTIAQMCVLRLCRPAVNAPVEVPVVKTAPAVMPIVQSAKIDTPKAEPIPSVKPVSESDEDFYKKFLAQIKLPNIRFCIPQSGRYENGELFMYAMAKSEYDFAVRPETQKHLRAASEALGLTNCVIHVIPPQGVAREASDHTDTFSL